MATTLYKLSINNSNIDHDANDDVWFTDKDAALSAARAIASPGSLSADPGDTVTVEEVVSTVLFSEQKPELG